MTPGSDLPKWFDSSSSKEESDPDAAPNTRQLAYAVTQFLSDQFMINPTAEELRDEIAPGWRISSFRKILKGYEQAGLLEEKNGYWSLASDDFALAEASGQALSEKAIREETWGEYEDQNLDELPGIGESATE